MVLDDRKNIFWFIIDSVRTFRTGMDDRDRLDIMDEFGKDSVEFTNCFTSAPSSLLAAGAMFTGYPSAFIARHFNDWKFDDENISTIKTLVDEHGYTSIPLIDGRNAREKYQNLLPPFPSSYLPKGRHLRDYVWNNKELTEIFEHIIKTKTFDDPFVFVFWYDCRRDPNISQHVEKAIKLIKKHGYYDDSIVIMNSDHGYPDPRTKINEGFFKNMGHDMILTDDNIKTPLFIKYPGSPNGISIDNTVGHIDILPTIFDVLNISTDKKKDQYKFKGQSLRHIINREENNGRCIRSDTRLRMDNNKITAYCKKHYKYIYFHDDNYSLLFNLENDPMELNNLAAKDSSKELVKDFKEINKSYDEELMKFHAATIRSNFIKSIERLNLLKKHRRFLIITPAPNELVTILVDLLNEQLHPKTIDLIKTGNFEIANKQLNIIDVPFECVGKELSKRDNYDVIIYITHNSRRVFLKDNIVKQIKVLKSKRKLLMNYNFETFKYFSLASYLSYIKLYFDWSRKGYFYKQEPAYFLNDAFLFIKFLFQKIFTKRLKNNNDIMTAREVMAFRQAHLKNEEKGLKKMEEGQMAYEVQRIKEWGDD
jgi:hypothetical protein